ncbi:MAG TPA: threonine/serine exporter family protein [Prolixibacteraceae bacterium]|nr:threonine/serine exporter family protein [Prolixibacteraceae bacterium]
MNQELGKIADVLLETGALLMGAGANTGRIRVTVNRIAHSLGYQVELLITHRALMVSVIDDEGETFTSKLKRTPPHGVNFKVLSGISRMSWRVQDEDWELDRINEELNRLKSLPHYPRWLILLLVSLAGATFCRLFGGGGIEMLVAFIATFLGLFVRQEAVKKNFNLFICVLMAAAVASLIAGAAVKLGIGKAPELAFATSVLFLVPGVPLINSFTDLIDGNVSTGIVRGVNGFMIAFCIALGMMLAMVLYKI